MELDLPPERFDALVESTAYFVVAEALANVAKHAQASEAAVSVSAGNGRLVVSVADDGRGGAPARPGRGTGLAGLTDRVEAVGGTLTVVSPKGSGTRVTAELPLDSEPVSAPAAG